jgi:putative DNA methylase
VSEGAYGTAETLSKAKNTSIAAMIEAQIVWAKGGKVRLLRRDELADDWALADARHLPIWTLAQHLAHALDKQGEAGAAALLAHSYELGAVVRDLAYRLYTICERKRWSQEALAYNSLVVAWPEIARLATEGRRNGFVEQPTLM